MNPLILNLAVLGLHAIKEKPVAINGKVEIRPVRDHSLCGSRAFLLTFTSQMMYLALTYDHRLLDGREAVVFLVKVRTGSRHFRIDSRTIRDSNVHCVGERVHRRSQENAIGLSGKSYEDDVCTSVSFSSCRI